MSYLKQTVGKPTRFGSWLARKMLFFWTKTTVLPASLDELDIDPEKPILYLMEEEGFANVMMLDKYTRQQALPRPLASIPLGEKTKLHAHEFVRRFDGLLQRPSKKAVPPMIKELAEHLDLALEQGLQIVPVSIFWGRSPDKEESWLRAMFSETWQRMGFLRRFFKIVVNGRQAHMQFSRPLDLTELMHEQQGISPERLGRKLSRVLRVHFRRTRKAAIGPELLRRDSIVNEVVKTEGVQDQISRLLALPAKNGKKKTQTELNEEARGYVREIAATYSYRTVRFFDHVLSWLWNKHYDGIQLHGEGQLRELAAKNNIVYVPCHRSHIDYLLLSYVMYYEGLMPPHVAAGINLNMPVVGKFLRNAGAFFIRRSFANNKLYSTVFREYMNTTQQRGVPIEYFIEGGRSRTGRLLTPKAGLLSMSTRAYVSDSSKPTAFIPVFIGYEKLWEGNSYLKELQGKTKRKESVGGIFKAMQRLRGGKMGRVYANFGKPLFLEEHLDRFAPEWKDFDSNSDEKPTWLVPTVNALGQRILKRINRAVVLDPVNLLSYVLLSTPRLHMGSKELARQIDKLIQLQSAAPYASETVLPTERGEHIVSYVESLKLIEAQKHNLGDTYTPVGKNAILMSYYRNNVQHAFALPSLIAAIFLDNKPLYEARVLQLVEMVYPYIQQELFLRYGAEELKQAVAEQLRAMRDVELLKYDEEEQLWSRYPAESPHAAELENLAQGMLQTLGRYYLLLVLLVRHGKNGIKQSDLENLVQLSAQQMSRLHDISSPEFFDKRLFQGFIRLLKERGLVEINEDGLLNYKREMLEFRENAEAVLSERFRQVIFRVIFA